MEESMARYAGDFDDRDFDDRGVPLYGNQDWGRGYGQDRGLGFGRGGAYGTHSGWVTGQPQGPEGDERWPRRLRRERSWGGSDGLPADSARRLRARDIMTEEPFAATPEMSLGEVARWMEELDVGIVPVLEDDEGGMLAGVITDRDIVVRGLARGLGPDAPVSACMTPRVATVDGNAPVRLVMDIMRRERVRRVPVTDGEGRLVGIIAQADLSVHYAGLDEEREREVEEVVERISEPALPRRAREGWYGPRELHASPRREGVLREGMDAARRGAERLVERAREILD
jgi:CBS domain-containing protein